MTEVQPAISALEGVAESIMKKYIEDHIHTFLAEHVPNIVAAQLESIAAQALDSATTANRLQSIPELHPI